MARSREKVGLWVVGACGGVATTAIVGIEAIRRRLADPTGLIGHLPPFDRLRLAPLDAWVVGGHEIRNVTPEQSARELLEESRIFSPELLTACRRWLQACAREIRDGTALGCGPAIEGMVDRRGSRAKLSPAGWVERLTDDILSFRKRHKLSRVVVLNVTSTEPPLRTTAVHQKWKDLQKALARRGASPVPASTLYALAAIEAGAAYLNFTPCVGIDLPAAREYAESRGIAYMGADGKTGETMMKSVLAPMFAARNLRVMSWVGHNIFGNRDGIVLDDPQNKAAKVHSKDHLVAEMLGYAPQTLVSIEYIKSMRDWKTAWDHIHFEGFLGTPMVLQFIWQGCDSILAAPLAIEMARFAERAMRDGHVGPLRHLACFFKSPMDVKEQGFARQYEALLDYAKSAAAKKKQDVRRQGQP